MKINLQLLSIFCKAYISDLFNKMIHHSWLKNAKATDLQTHKRHNDGDAALTRVRTRKHLDFVLILFDFPSLHGFIPGADATAIQNDEPCQTGSGDRDRFLSSDESRAAVARGRTNGFSS